MKSVFAIDTHHKPFHVIWPARTHWLATLSTLMLVNLLSQTMADAISLSPLVSHAFDDQSQHMVVASCLTGVGYLSIFDVESEF